MNEKVIELLQAAIDELSGKDAPEVVPESTGPTDEEISMNVSGRPDLHLTDPTLFNKMKKYYAPEKEPFTTSTWQTLGMIGADTRPYKPEEVQGILARRKTRQHGAPNWYWISRGYFWIGDQWYKRVTSEDGVTSEEAIFYFEDCPMSGLDTNRWPAKYREAYEG